MLEERARESGLGLVMRGNGVPVGRIMQDAAVLGLHTLCEQYGVHVEGAGGPSTLVSTQPARSAGGSYAPDEPGSYSDTEPDEDFEI